MAKKATTEAVLQHHVQALVSRNLDSIMKDYCDDSVLCTPNGTFKGLDSIRSNFTALLGMFTPEVLANLKSIKQDIVGEYAYVLWSALPAVTFGGDTFYIRNGKIMLQSFVGQM
jgi:ketosteroid isomerase-like protein